MHFTVLSFIKKKCSDLVARIIKVRTKGLNIHEDVKTD